MSDDRFPRHSSSWSVELMRLEAFRKLDDKLQETNLAKTPPPSPWVLAGILLAAFSPLIIMIASYFWVYGFLF